MRIKTDEQKKEIQRLQDVQEKEKMEMKERDIKMNEEIQKLQEIIATEFIGKQSLDILIVSKSDREVHTCVFR